MRWGIIAAAALAACAARRRLATRRNPSAHGPRRGPVQLSRRVCHGTGELRPVDRTLDTLRLVLFRRKSPWAEFAAGALLAIAPWIKVYPGLLGVGLVGLRRWHGLAGFILAALLFGLVDFQEVQRFARNCGQYMHNSSLMEQGSPPAPAHPWCHSLPENWHNLWQRTPPPLAWLAHIEGHVATALLLVPLLTWTTFHVYRSRRREELTYPFLIWVTALACFVPRAANDYSLVFLPLAALAVWDRHDPLLVHVGLAALLLWWQPFALPIDGNLLLIIKVAGLAMVGVSLAERASGPIPLAVVSAEFPGVHAA